MKLRIFFVIVAAISFSLTAYSQDSTKKVLKPRMKSNVQIHKKKYRRMHSKRTAIRKYKICEES